MLRPSVAVSALPRDCIAASIPSRSLARAQGRPSRTATAIHNAPSGRIAPHRRFAGACQALRPLGQQVPTPEDPAQVRPHSPLDASTHERLASWAANAASTKAELPDIVNIPLEELVRLRYELPPLETLSRIAGHARSHLNETIHLALTEALDEPLRTRLEEAKVRPHSSLNQGGSAMPVNLLALEKSSFLTGRRPAAHEFGSAPVSRRALLKNAAAWVRGCNRTGRLWFR